MSIDSGFSEEKGKRLIIDDKNKSYKSSDLVGAEEYPSFKGHQSIANRYSVFSYRGRDSTISKDEKLVTVLDRQQTFRDIQGVGTQSNIEGTKNSNNSGRPKISTEKLYDPSTATLVNIFSPFSEHEEGTGSMIYEWPDFLYTKYDNKLSNNRLLTLRRFPLPIEDDITNPDTSPHKDLGRMLSWFGEGTDNALSDIIGFSIGFNWKELESEVQEIDKAGYGGSLGILDMSEIPGIGGALGPAAKAFDSTVDNANRERSYQYDPLKSEKFSEGPYRDLIDGPVNVIHKMLIQDRGLNYTNDITIKFGYELKSYGNVNPKEALLDVFTNILSVCYTNAPFWGGSVRYVRGQGQSNSLIGDGNLLRQGKLLQYFNSVFGDLGGVFSKNFGDSNGGFSLGSISKGLGAAFTDRFFEDKINEKGPFANMQVAKALLTGESTGEWHLTVGNPLRPIVMMGNLVLEDCTISFDESLGTDDFPVGITAEVKLKPARPRDGHDIQSMFNAGKGRMYFFSKELGNAAKQATSKPKKNISKGKGKEPVVDVEGENKYRKDTIDFNNRLANNITGGAKESVNTLLSAVKFSPIHFSGPNNKNQKEKPEDK